MADLRDLIGDLKNTSKSSLIYTLLMANILGLSIFLRTNGKESLNRVKEETTNVKTSLKNNEEEIPDALASKVFEQENTTDKDIKEAVEENRQNNFQEKVEGTIEQQAPSEALKVTPQEKQLIEEPTLELEYKQLSENKKEKVINFEEAAKEIRSKESAKEKPKTLVWHFPKAISKK